MLLYRHIIINSYYMTFFKKMFEDMNKTPEKPKLDKAQIAQEAQEKFDVNLEIEGEARSKEIQLQQEGKQDEAYELSNLVKDYVSCCTEKKEDFDGPEDMKMAS